MNTRALIGKLSVTSLAAFEKAASLAVTQRHYAIEIEHLVLALIQEERTGVRSSLKKYGVNTDQLEGDILIRFESFEKGHTSAPSFRLMLSN